MRCFGSALSLSILLLASSTLHADLIAVQDFDGGSPNWSFTSDPVGPFSHPVKFWQTVGSIGDVGNLLFMEDDFWGIRDLENDENPSGIGTLSFAAVDISNATDVTFSFDYSVFEWDNGDDIFYELSFDNVAQGENQVVNGTTDLTTSGTAQLPIPDSVDSLAVTIRVIHDGGSDWGGVDSFELNGTVVAVPEPSAFLFGGLVCSVLGVNYVRRRCLTKSADN